MAKKTKTQANKPFRPSDPEKYAYAHSLYMQAVPLNEIAERVKVSRQTVSKWQKAGSWEGKRAANAISRDTLIAKVMQRMDEMLDSADEFKADAFAKAAKQLKDLQKGASVDDTIEVLSKFGEYLERIAPIRKDITTDFVRQLVTLQDEYIQAKIRELQ